MPWNNPDHVENIARPIVAVGNEYPPAFELDWHQHRRGQLLYAARGVVVVSTPHGAWVAPPERAVWTPGGCRHSVRMVGAVSTRSVLIEADAPGSLGPANRVIQISPLLRILLETACAIEPEYAPGSRDELVMALLMAELVQAPTVPLAVPFPQTPAIAAKCQAFLEHPTPHDTIDLWSSQLGLGRRAFTRLFSQETGLSFGAWRQQACVLVALPSSLFHPDRTRRPASDQAPGSVQIRLDSCRSVALGEILEADPRSCARNSDRWQIHRP